MQVRGSIEEAEELQENDQKGENGERVKPASRDRQKELLGRLPPSEKQRGRQMDYTPYEHKHHQQNHHDAYDDY